MRQLFFPLFFVVTIAASETKENSAIATLVNDLAQETNKTAAAIQTAASGNEIVQQLESWSVFFDGWKKKANSLEKKKGFKFLKAPEPPEELKGDVEAFMTSVNTMSQTLQAKVELFKDNPKFNKRIQQVLGKLKDL